MFDSQLVALFWEGSGNLGKWAQLEEVGHWTGGIPLGAI
jgi:hypothetical protein